MKDKAREALRQCEDALALPLPDAQAILDRARFVVRSKARARERALRIAAIVTGIVIVVGSLLFTPPVQAFIAIHIRPYFTEAVQASVYSLSLDRAILQGVPESTGRGMYQKSTYIIDGFLVELIVEPASIEPDRSSNMLWNLDSYVVPTLGVSASCYQDEECAFAEFEYEDQRIILIVKGGSHELLYEVLDALRAEDYE